MVEPHEKIYKSKRQIFVDNFIGGIAWSLGATVGLTLIFALLAFIVTRINFIPIFGDFISDIIKEVLNNNPQLMN